MTLHILLNSTTKKIQTKNEKDRARGRGGGGTGRRQGGREMWPNINSG